MTDPTITDLRRELEKARHALIDAQSHLASHAEMNAALHCATTVMYSPLHAKVTAAIGQIEHALTRTEPNGEQHEDYITRLIAGILADLDRCEHGRHTADSCDGCPQGHSAGNPHLTVGQQIGYGVRGDGIYVPHPDDRWVPEAWRSQPNPEETP
ncbi:hypothetical protein [Streptomyces mirabilis]|uniref:hypothetical protein n=1 Tax=Streptomyces mirabilis TaxID=68239 RepID=UPI003410A943